MSSTMRRTACALIIVLIVMTLIPVDALASGANEKRALRRWDSVWSVLDSAEENMMEKGASGAEITMAVFRAAINCPLIDEGSISDLTENEFSFRTGGMLGGYNFRVRNGMRKKGNGRRAFFDGKSELTSPAARYSAAARGAGLSSAKDVLLVGPYYGADDAFSDQYKGEANAIAGLTGGNVVSLEYTEATGPAIAANMTDKCVVIFDSHGNCVKANGTSYIDLKSNVGITSADYINGWAFNGGSFYGVDGRYIASRLTSPLAGCLVWCATCDGMNKDGRGTMGAAFLRAGAACVYGYSRSVSTSGDSKFAASFWKNMREGADVASAMANMKEECGEWDPIYYYPDDAARPIVMSAADPFPKNTNEDQTVECGWKLFAAADELSPVESVTVEPVEVKLGAAASAVIGAEPANASFTVLSYSVSDASVASVSAAGKVCGVGVGTTELTVTVRDDSDCRILTASAPVTVVDHTGYVLTDGPVSGGSYIIVSNGCAVSGTAGPDGTLLQARSVTENDDGTLTLLPGTDPAELTWKASPYSILGWSFMNSGSYMSVNGSGKLCMASSPYAWSYNGTDLNSRKTALKCLLGLDPQEEYFTLVSTAGNGIGFYTYVEGDPTPTAQPTPTPPIPKPTPTPTPTPAADVYEPVDFVTEGETYLIGCVSGGSVYLLMNSNPDTENNYFQSADSSYNGYAIKAVTSGGSVTDVDTSVYPNAEMENVEWTFEKVEGYYRIRSLADEAYYLRVYSGARYTDLYPAVGTLSASKWRYSDGELSYTVSPCCVKYVGFTTDCDCGDGVFRMSLIEDHVQLYRKKTENNMPPPSPEPTEVPDDEPTVWRQTDTIVPGNRYLIGFVVGDDVYLMMNSNPSPADGNMYYFSHEMSYYGYAAKATVSNGGVVGCSGWTNDLERCEWTFSTEKGGSIVSAYDERYSLSCIASAKYEDLRPSTSTLWNRWTWNPQTHTLTHRYSVFMKYAAFKPTLGEYEGFCCAKTRFDPANGYVRLFVSD